MVCSDAMAMIHWNQPIHEIHDKSWNYCRADNVEVQNYDSSNVKNGLATRVELDLSDIGKKGLTHTTCSKIIEATNYHA